MFQSCRQGQNTHFMFNDFFFPRQSYHLCNIMEEYSRARQAADDSMANAHCMLDTQSHKYTLKICNTYCFSTTTLVAQTRLNVMLYTHCLSCFSQCLASTLSFVSFENSPQRCPHKSVSKLCLIFT